MINFFNGKILLCLKVNKMEVGAEKNSRQCGKERRYAAVLESRLPVAVRF